MAEKQTKPNFLKQKLDSQLGKIDDLNNAIYECKLRLNSVKPLVKIKNSDF